MWFFGFCRIGILRKGERNDILFLPFITGPGLFWLQAVLFPVCKSIKAEAYFRKTKKNDPSPFWTNLFGKMPRNRGISGFILGDNRIFDTSGQNEGTDVKSGVLEPNREKPYPLLFGAHFFPICPR